MMDVTSVKRIHQSDWTDSGVRFLRARDIVAESKNEEVSEPLFISQEKYDEYSAISGKVEKGDLLVTGVGTIGVPMLINSEEPLYFKDGNIIWFKNKNTIDGRFFYHSFNGLNIQKFIKESAGTGTVGTYTIETGKKTPINLPPQKEEQEKIGLYFSNLDNLITLHQRKSFYNIANINVWEQRKFGDVAVRESSISASTSDIPSVEYEDVVAEEGRLNKDIRLKEVVKSGIIFDGSQVLYGKLRPYLHNWLNPDFNGIAVGDWWVLKPINMDKNFLYRLIQTQQFDNIANQSSGSKMPRADWNLISNSEFMVSFSKEEQRKIGGYFDNLDHLITLHRRAYHHIKRRTYKC